MVRQHNSTGTDANGASAARNVADDDRRGRARDSGHIMMLGKPKTPISPAFGMLREI